MKFIIERKTLIWMLFIGVTLLGYVSYRQLSVEMLPNVELPFLYVQASASMDSDPKYIENEIVIPLEGAIGTMEGIESLESNINSRSGTIVVYFKKNVNFNLSYLRLQEKVNEIKNNLPDGVTVSVNRVDLTRNTSQFMELQARGEGGVDRVRNIVDQEITTQLENIDGIAGVSVYGGKQRSIEVVMDEEACKAYGITTATIRNLLGSNSQSRVYAGNLKENDRLYFVHVTAEYDEVTDIENIIVAPGPILLKDVARVSFGVKEITSYSRVNGQDAINIRLVNDSQSNQIELSHRVRKVVEKINEEMVAKDVQLVIQQDSAESMEKNIDQIVNLALTGGVLAIFVLWMFLRNIRIVAFVALSIPISVYTAFNLFYAYGITLNSLTLVGMALAVGMLLDNSVVVLENIYRLAGAGRSPGEAVTVGTTEVWRSIVASTLTTVTVFLPFLFSSEYMVEVLGRNVGISIVSTLMISLVVSLMFIPMLIHFLLTRKNTKPTSFIKLDTNNRLVQIYVVILKTCMRSPATTIIGATILFFIVVFLSLSLNMNTTKEVESDQIRLSVTMPTGSSLATTDEMVRKIEEKLQTIDEKEDIFASVQEEQATLTLTLVDKFQKLKGNSFAQIKSEVDKMTRNMSPATIDIQEGTSTQSGSGAGNMMGNFTRFLGIGSQQERILLKGQDYATMQIVAEDLQYFLSEMDFIARARVSSSSNRPEVHMIFDNLIMSEYNIGRNNISSELNSFSNEISTGVQFKQGVDEYEIILKPQEEPEETEEKKQEETRTMEKLKQMQVPDQAGGLHELQDFTRLVYARGLSGINRVNQEKQIEVRYSMSSDAQESKELMESYRAEIDALIAGYNFPTGIAAEVIHEEDDFGEFQFLILAAIILIFMIMASVFESFSTPFVLLFSIPLAAIGSMAALLITGNSLFNANTMIGFLILLGVVVNNGIILIDYANILMKRGYRMSRAVMVAGLSRVRPILITALTTIVAMFPMAMGQAEYVSVIGAPFAIVVIGGLAVSTLLTLVFVPTFYFGLENALKWFRNLSLKLRIVQLVLMAAGVVFVYLRIDSLMWQIVDYTLVFVLIPGATWFIMNSLKKAGTKLIGADEHAHIVIRNLVKVYDRPGKVSREWQSGLKIRRRYGLVKEYHTWRDLAPLIWQLPVVGFFFYFTFMFIGNIFWVCVLLPLVYASIRAIWKPVGQFMSNRSTVGAKIAGAVSWVLFWVLPLAEMFILFLKSGHLGIVLAYTIIWYLVDVIYITSKRLYDEKVNVNRITGRFGSLRRTTYRIVQQIPIIGKRRTPFKALDGVSLEIGTGMFGLLGPNGAGKSTMMRIVCGILTQSYGKIFINGIDTQEKREELQGLIGYLPQEFGAYETMPAWEYLEYQALLKGLTDRKQREERLEYVLKAVHMYDHRTEKINSFSGGMKQRIGIAMILLHLPKILVVDEPTAGLDPRERIRFRNLLVELSRERIVIFSTHIIEDIASSCRNLAVIIRGRVKYRGNPSDMVHLANGLVWQYDISVQDFDNMSEADKKMVVHHMPEGNKIRMRVLSKTQPAPDAISITPILEDAYLCLIKDLKL
ncbi:MAG: efflux RND transporter permease subunit [Bacteroidales bacterium]|jgi:multidrug efflux pump subunit AcrB/ABC-type multidrug transport system ATPase subunit|nr:efflux RND transporter permease subunit [Bacteroidales bacterium]